jgi:hypothetical protein
MSAALGHRSGFLRRWVHAVSEGRESKARKVIEHYRRSISSLAGIAG